MKQFEIISLDHLGVYPSMWELRVGSGPRKPQKVENFHFTWYGSEPDAMLSQKNTFIPRADTNSMYSYPTSSLFEVSWNTDNRVTFTIWFQLEVTQNRTSNRDRKSTCRMVFSLKRFDEFLVFLSLFSVTGFVSFFFSFSKQQHSRTSSLKIKTKKILKFLKKRKTYNHI